MYCDDDGVVVVANGIAHVDAFVVDHASRKYACCRVHYHRLQSTTTYELRDRNAILRK